MGRRATPGPRVSLTWLRCCCSACRQPPPPPAGHGSPAGTQQKGCHRGSGAREHPGTDIPQTHTLIPICIRQPTDVPTLIRHTPIYTYVLTPTHTLKHNSLHHILYISQPLRLLSPILQPYRPSLLCPSDRSCPPCCAAPPHCVLLR